MDLVYHLRRARTQTAHHYRLYGTDGACLLSGACQHALYLPSMEIRTPSGDIAARISRGRLLNFDIVTSDAAGRLRFTIALPRLQTLFRKAPFDVTGPQGERMWQMMPASTWRETGGENISIWHTITDGDLVVLRGQEALGHTSQQGEAAPPAPSMTGVVANLVTLPLALGRIAYDELTGASLGKETPCGALHLGRPDAGLSDIEIMMLLLFRRFDYRSMRQVE
jgi:hypothetical protein